MQTVLEILNKTTEYFKKCNVPDARLDAQYILAKGLGMSRMDLYLKFDRPVTEEELALMRPMVQRRGKREPLQHILGSASFRGIEIKCDQRALIPRPETEVLVDLALEKIAKVQNPIVLDVGTGTGAIAIAIAKARPDANVYALDISNDALALAKENVESLSLQTSVHLLHSNLLSALSKDLQFDLLISNPPYIPSSTIATLEPEVKDHDPVLALDGGKVGLELTYSLLEQALGHLKSDGKVVLELGEGQAETLKQVFLGAGAWFVELIGKDFQGVARFPVLVRKEFREQTVG